MTSRERILAALDHRQPDRVPVDFGGHRSSGIAALAYPKLRRHLGLPPRPIRVYDVVQQLAVVDEDVLDRFGVDTVEMGRGFLCEDRDWKEWVLPDGTPCEIPRYINLEKRGEDWHLLSGDGRPLAVQRKGWLYFEQTSYPLAERGISSDDFSDLDEIFSSTSWTGAAHPGAHLPLNPAGLGEMAERARTLREKTTRAVIGLFGGNMFELPQWLYRMENYLMAMKRHPQAVLRLSESLCSIHLNALEKWLGAVGPFIDIVLFGDDLGGQQGLLISPEMYREFIKPFHRKLWRRAKELAGVRVMLHSCGSIRDLFEDFIEAGLDAVNPVQTSCAGMDPAALKTKYGGRLTLWGGGCDTRDMLPQASPEEVSEHVKARVRVMAPGGGFVFQQVHNILADVPPENIAAMFDAVNA